MSTKCTIAYGERFHLYRDLMEDGTIHLKIEDGEFLADHRGIKVSIPLEIWEYIRQFQGVELPYLNMSDEDIRQAAERSVDERLSANASFGRLSGWMLYGDAEDPRDVQIERGVASMQKNRAESQALAERLQSFATSCKPSRSFSPEPEEDH